MLVFDASLSEADRRTIVREALAAYTGIQILLACAPAEAALVPPEVRLARPYVPHDLVQAVRAARSRSRA